MSLWCARRECHQDSHHRGYHRSSGLAERTHYLGGLVQKDQGFLVVIFPYQASEERPTIEGWAGGAGAKISWKGETHYVVLDARPHKINAEGLKGEASVLVAKAKGGTKSLSLPLNEAASFGSAKADRLRDFLKR